MLNSDSLNILNSITNITNSAIISYPITTISNISSDVLMNIDFSKVSEPFEEYGIYDLSSFLGALGVLDKPVITLNDKIITAKDNNSSIQFIISSPSSLEDYTTNPENITSTCAADSIVEIPISLELMNKIRKGANVFKTLKDLFIIKEGDSISMKTGNKESFNSRNNAYSINLEPSLNSGRDFEIVVPIENFLSLPQADFTMKIKYNPKVDMHRVVMENPIFQAVLTIRV